MSDPIEPAATAAMQRDIVDLQQQVRDLKTLQASGRRWVLGTIVLIVAMFALFSWTTYAKIRRNFDQQSVQRAVSAHGAEIMPMAQRMLMATGQNVMPVYRDAVVATLRTQGPTAATAAVQRLKDVPEQTGKVFQDKMAAAFDAAVKKVEPDFKAAYPNMADDKRQQLLQSFVADQIAAQNKQIASRVNQLYTNDLIRMQTTLEKFDGPKGAGLPGGSSDELERKFLHTMVALLDDQVDTAYPAAGGATATATTDDPSQPAAAKLLPAAGGAPPATQPVVR